MLFASKCRYAAVETQVNYFFYKNEIICQPWRKHKALCMPWMFNDLNRSLKKDFRSGTDNNNNGSSAHGYI